MRHVPSKLFRCASPLIWFYKPSVQGGCNHPRDQVDLVLWYLEALTQRLIRHSFGHLPFQGTVLIAGSYAIISIHFPEVPRTVDCKNSSLIRGAEIRGWKVKKFDRTDDFVDSASPLFAYA